MTRGPLPHPLPDLGSPFTWHDARRTGVSRRRMGAQDLERRVFGIRAEAGAYDDLASRCRMFAVRLPNEVFFSHATAALLVGAPLPFRLERGQTVHVTVPAPQRAPHATGVTGHSRRVVAGDIRVTGGIRHSSRERLWCELGTVLSVPPLVALGDFLIHHRMPLTTIGRLATRMRAGDRIARTPRLREALALLDERSESPRESILRVMLRDAGLTYPQINREVVEAADGGAIRSDFVFPDERVVVEYQGDYHRGRNQWRKDMTRRSRLESRGWYVVELNADDLGDPVELVARLRRVLARQARRIALDARVSGD